jgi:hypothetical protein
MPISACIGDIEIATYKTITLIFTTLIVIEYKYDINNRCHVNNGMGSNAQ